MLPCVGVGFMLFNWFMEANLIIPPSFHLLLSKSYCGEGREGGGRGFFSGLHASIVPMVSQE